MGKTDEGMGFDAGVPGASARHEHTRRKSRRELNLRAKHPRVGGVLLALQGEPAHERAWAAGAAGEELVAKQLVKYVRDGVLLLHDRRIPGTRSNIDHIAVAPSGVWVIDSKRYQGKVRIDRPLFGKTRLLIRGRDKTKLIASLDRQVELVRAAVTRVADVAVHGALCFVDADLPIFWKLSFNGYPLLYPRQLAKRINAPGPISDDAARSLTAALAEHFPRA